MQDERKFMRLLKEIVDIARADGNRISVEEVRDYLEELELNGQQMEAVYDYLVKGRINVVGYERIDSGNVRTDSVKPDDIKSDDVNQTGLKEGNVDNASKSGGADSPRTRQYRKNVRDIAESSPEIEKIYEEIYSGRDDDGLREDIIHAYLHVVANMSSRYSGRGVSGDELIQEGNLALILAVDELLSDYNERVMKSVTSFDRHMRECIRKGIISCVDEEARKDGELQAAIGRAQLVRDAAAYLSRELGRVASLYELAEFTHIDESEIEDIIRFSGNVVSTGDGE